MEPPSRRLGRNARTALPPVSVLVPERRWRRCLPAVECVVRRAASVAGRHDLHTVVLEGDLAVRRLNARHRGRNAATNVLTFEHDVVLAFGIVRREARQAGRPLAHHLSHLVVHAVLHLDGFDHVTAGDARRMERRESRLLSRIGVPNPYKPRAMEAAS